MIVCRVKEFRLEAGISQEELATRVGCHPLVIRWIENGDQIPDVILALKICDQLNLGVRHMYYGLEEN